MINNFVNTMFLFVSIFTFTIIIFLYRRIRGNASGFRLWMLMGIIALVAGMLAFSTSIVPLTPWAVKARTKAVFHATKAKNCREEYQYWSRLAQTYDDGGNGAGRQIVEYWRALAEAAARTAEYHERLSRKYYHAAIYPWLSVTPDPPEPQKPLRPSFLDDGYGR